MNYLSVEIGRAGEQKPKGSGFQKINHKQRFVGISKRLTWLPAVLSSHGQDVNAASKRNPVRAPICRRRDVASCLP